MKVLFSVLLFALFILFNTACRESSSSLEKKDSVAISVEKYPLKRKPIPYVPEVYQESLQTIQALAETNAEIKSEIDEIRSDTLPYKEKEKKIADLRRVYFINQDKIAKLEFESRCGLTDDSQPVELYDGSLGVSKEFVQSLSGSIGQLQWKYNFGDSYTVPGGSAGNVRGVRWCTGALITKDLFLTAGHCFDREVNGWKLPRKNGEVVSSSELATLMKVNFNYQVDGKTNKIRKDTIDFPVIQLVEYRYGGLDYAVIKLGANVEGKYPGDVFGFINISADNISLGTVSGIIQHPLGNPKVIEAGPITILNSDLCGYHDVDTEGGSSGSPVISSIDKKIIGVHVLGGCDPDHLYYNSATAIKSIMQFSPIIKKLATVR